MKPRRVSIRSYQVGFGDCFLFTVHYTGGENRHVLIDFGSTGLPDGVPRNRLKAIAKDIQAVTDGKLTAVVASHRHKDHISGFATNASGTGSGDIIAKLKPDMVVQPWTEDPDLEETATAPSGSSGAPGLSAAAHRVRTLWAMQKVADQIWAEARRNRSLGEEVRARLGFLGESNVKNLNAVKNLMAMTGDKTKNRYVHAGMASGLEDLLPGVKVDVLGPPTVEQHEEVQTQTSWDNDEFWARLAAAGDLLPRASRNRLNPLFPSHLVKREKYRFPVNARWFVSRAKQLRGEQMLRIVTMLDNALNNTSVILLFRVAGKSFLFPGDAQIENWEYALAQEKIRKLLRAVDVYKVGHHGSRNATPKSLWDLFERRSTDKHDPHRLTSMMSTLPDKHGSEANKSEVPRRTLVRALEKHSAHFTTQDVATDELCLEVSFDLS